MNAESVKIPAECCGGPFCGVAVHIYAAEADPERVFLLESREDGQVWSYRFSGRSSGGRWMLACVGFVGKKGGVE